MDAIFKKVQAKAQHFADEVKKQTQSQGGDGASAQAQGQQGGDASSGSKGPMEIVYKQIDKYVDGLAPEIAPVISREITAFKTRTLESLEDHLKDAFESVFRGDLSAFHRDRDLSSFARSRAHISNTGVSAAPGGVAAMAPGALSVNSLTRGLDFVPRRTENISVNPATQAQPTGYGQRGVPFLKALGQLKDALDGDDDDDEKKDAKLRDEKNIFEDALKKVSAFADKVDDRLDDLGDLIDTDLGRIIKSISKQIDAIKRDPGAKAKEAAPKMREDVGRALEEKHEGLAEKLTKIALDEIKKYLRGHTRAKDVGDGMKEDVGDVLSSLFAKTGLGGNSNSNKTRSVSPSPASTPFGEVANNSAGALDRSAKPDFNTRDSNSPAPVSSEGAPRGIAGLLSTKIGHGLARIRTSTRDEFVAILTAIERVLFEILPDCLKGPLSLVFGGNPFEAKLKKENRPENERGGKWDFFDEILDRIWKVVERIQMGLRDRVLEVVAGGHRVLESEAWRQVHETVVTRVRKIVPGVRVQVEDDGKDSDDEQPSDSSNSNTSNNPNLPAGGFNLQQAFPPQYQTQQAPPQQQQHQYPSSQGEASSFWQGGGQAQGQSHQGQNQGGW